VKLISFLLAVIALLLVWVLALPLYVLGIFIVKIHHAYHLTIAVSLDQLGNVLGGPLFNVILKKKGGYKFGHEDDTISMCLAINYLINNLTWFGLLIANTLERIDNGHLEKAIEKCRHSNCTC